MSTSGRRPHHPAVFFRYPHRESTLFRSLPHLCYPPRVAFDYIRGYTNRDAEVRQLQLVMRKIVMSASHFDAKQMALQALRDTGAPFEQPEGAARATE
jgi:hypothetical protein